MYFKVNNVLSIHVRDTNRMFHGESEEIGQSIWTDDGIIAFENVSYVAQKTVLEFHGCTDGEKVVGRLCMYYDESLGNPNKFLDATDTLNSGSPSPLSSPRNKGKRNSNKESTGRYNAGNVNTNVNANGISDDLDIDDDDTTGVTDFGGQLAELKLRSSNSKDKTNRESETAGKTSLLTKRVSQEQDTIGKKIDDESSDSDDNDDDDNGNNNENNHHQEKDNKENKEKKAG